MKIAIVGAGYVGLATAWYFTQKNIDVTVFDGPPGASHASTGLLHPYPGKKGLLSLRGEEGMRESMALLKLASKRRSVFEQNGIFRFFENGEKKLIKEGASVYSRPYLDELKNLCPNVKFENQNITSLQELSAFDVIILAAGAKTLEFDECKHLQLKRTIGQSLLCQWPEKLPMSLLFPGGHITPTEDPNLCQVGSTYEYTSEPDPEKALELLQKAIPFCQDAQKFKLVEIRSGIRISPKIGYQPVIEKVRKNAWVITGFGSRGLLYHAIFSKQLVFSVLRDV